jgi:hypothetical protein
MAHAEGHEIGLERPRIAGSRGIDDDAVVHDPQQWIVGTEVSSALPGPRGARACQERTGGEARDQREDDGPVADHSFTRAWPRPRPQSENTLLEIMNTISSQGPETEQGLLSCPLCLLRGSKSYLVATEV